MNFNLKLILIILSGYLCSDIFTWLSRSLKAKSLYNSALIEGIHKSNNSNYEFSTISYSTDKNNYEFLNQFKNDLEKSKNPFFFFF